MEESFLKKTTVPKFFENLTHDKFLKGNYDRICYGKNTIYDF